MFNPIAGALMIATRQEEKTPTQRHPKHHKPFSQTHPQQQKQKQRRGLAQIFAKRSSLAL